MQTLDQFGDSALAQGGGTVVFAHANGYPPGSYRALLAPIAEEYRLFTVEHRPLWSDEEVPRRLGWQVYADDLIATLDQARLGPVWLVGHSMGAVTGMLAALKRPDLFSGLAALDPVLLPLRYWLMAQLAGRIPGGEIPIAQIALKRPHHFQSHEAAFQFYRGKRPFRRLSDAVLWDYVYAGHREVPGHGVELCWSGAWEACVYRSAPSILYRLAKWQLPMLGIAGLESDVLSQSALQRWQRVVPGLELEVLPGGHLIPLEAPDACAARILDFLQVENPATRDAPC